MRIAYQRFTENYGVPHLIRLHEKWVLQHLMSQRPGRVGRPPALCSGYPGFDSCPRCHLSQLVCRDSSVSPRNYDRPILSSPHIQLRTQKKKTKHITALEENDEPCISIRVKIKYTKKLSVYFLLPNDIYCCHQHVVFKFELLEDTTKSPYVNRHGIFLMVIMNVNVMLISSINCQCQLKNSRCGNGYTFSCHSILRVFSN